MKILYLATLAAAAVVVAEPRQHHAHRRAHEVAKRASEPSRTVTAPAVTRTAVRYVLDGNIISEEEVRNGIANGTLMWGIVEAVVPSKQGPVALPTDKPTPSSTQQEQKMPQSKSSVTEPSVSVRPHLEELTQPNENTTDKPPSQSAPKPPDTVPDNSPKTAQELVDANGNCESCNKVFPNGQLPCNQFPHGYGAMPVDQEGLGGWSGIQDPGYRGGDGFDDIVTVPSGSCKDGSCCKPGHWCSYGCPNPYLKLSFPKKQGRTGQTVGGLYCNPDGMLEMADGSLGKTLCGKDSQHMTVKVHNRLSKPVSICRTDYPGTESMTFPLTLKPGQIGYLANPDQSKYFFWQNKPTSAHYYINKQGVSEAQGCTWGDPNGDKGNWAPAIFGTSYDDIHSNEGYSSLKQNELNKNNLLDYSITFTGDGVVSPCSYKKKTDEYCRGKECWHNKDEGCTAAIKKGSTLTLVLHDDD